MKTIPDEPLFEDAEARLTAMVLGELSPEEASLLKKQIAADRKLQELLDSIEKTVGVLKESFNSPPRHLSLERRKKILSTFKSGARKSQLIDKMAGQWRRRSEWIRADFLKVAAMLAGLMILSRLSFNPRQIRDVGSSFWGYSDGLSQEFAMAPAPTSLGFSGGSATFEQQSEKAASAPRTFAYAPAPTTEPLATLDQPTVPPHVPAGHESRSRQLSASSGGRGGNADGLSLAVTVDNFSPRGLQESSDRSMAAAPTPGVSVGSAVTATSDAKARNKSTSATGKIAPTTPMLAKRYGLPNEQAATPLPSSGPPEPVQNLDSATRPTLMRRINLQEATALKSELAEGESLAKKAAAIAPAAPPTLLTLNPPVANAAVGRVPALNNLADASNGNQPTEAIIGQGIQNGIALEDDLAKKNQGGAGGLAASTDSYRLSGSLNEFGRGERDQKVDLGRLAEISRFSSTTFVAKDSETDKPELADTRVAGRKMTEEKELPEGYQLLKSKKILSQVLADSDQPVLLTRESQATTPQPEIVTTENPYSTFSLNVSDVSFKTAEAALQNGTLPEPRGIRSEEFVNAFNYGDPAPQAGAPVGFTWERALYPFAHRRDLLRFSVKTAASGRQAGMPLNLVLLLDNSGSMERADRVNIIRECARTLTAQLQPGDRVSLISFARTARLCANGLTGETVKDLPSIIEKLRPEGGTNLEEALRLAYETARNNFAEKGMNRVVLLTDGAANLGNLDVQTMKQKVEMHRKQGIALDCFGIGWDGLNDDLLENLSRNGDGRYGFVNDPDSARSEFAAQLAGALNVAASDVKMQVEFNSRRVNSYRQIGYANHQLTAQQFRDNTVDAAEIGAAESGNALYVVQLNAAGEGPIATVRARFKTPGTTDYKERSWNVPYSGNAPALEQAPATMRLAGTAAAFAEWLSSNPYAAEVNPSRLLALLNGVVPAFPGDTRPQRLENMIRQSSSISGNR